MRIATGCIGHETNTFSPIPTSLESFEGGSYATGEEVVRAFGDTETVTGGFIERAGQLGVELVPLLWTFATPAGVVEQRAYDTLKRRFLQLLDEAGAIDGVVLDLHGAMVTEKCEDAEGDLLGSIRSAVGSLPIVSTLDLHANATAKMAANADSIVGFDTYPHVDCYQRGLEAMQIVFDTVQGNVRPTMSYRQLPLLTPPPAQCTMRAPMSDVLGRLHELEARPGVVTATVSMGFPFSDIRDAGTSVLVTTDGDNQLAETCADALASYLWEQRERFECDLISIEGAIARAKQTDGKPIVLAEGSDNPGGGGPCDGTHILRAFVEAGVQDAVIAVIADPESLERAIRVGVGSSVELEVGGKTDALHGEPVSLSAYVRVISDGQFVHKGPMSRGKPGGMGRTAVVSANGIEILLTEHRVQPYDAEILRSVGIAPEDRKLIALKSAVHFRAAYTPIAHEILDVDTPGVHNPNLFGYDYEKLRRPVFPLDSDASFGSELA